MLHSSVLRLGRVTVIQVLVKGGCDCHRFQGSLTKRQVPPGQACVLMQVELAAGRTIVHCDASPQFSEGQQAVGACSGRAC